MLPEEQRDLRVAAIVVALLACAAVRFTGLGDHGPLEIVPVLGAGLWFGRRWAFLVAGVAGAVAAVSALVDGTWDLSMTAVHIALLALTAYASAGSPTAPGPTRPSSSGSARCRTCSPRASRRGSR